MSKTLKTPTAAPPNAAIVKAIGDRAIEAAVCLGILTLAAESNEIPPFRLAHFLIEVDEIGTQLSELCRGLTKSNNDVRLWLRRELHKVQARMNPAPAPVASNGAGN
jgi:hypothetical protein